jgi:cyclic pyranopterin phosphate synthase
MKNTLTHFDKTGSAHMVDVTNKAETHRTAVATCKVNLSDQSVILIKDGTTKKGDVLGVARLAGIMAAKKTSDIIPLCHPLSLSKISIEFIINADLNHIEIQATVKTSGKTGVEMEALTAVSISALTIYDMLKSIDKSIIIKDTRLLFKDGGKSGTFKNTEKLL